MLKTGDVIKVCQVGSSNTIFRESNEYTVFDPNYVEEEEESELEESETSEDADE